MRASHFVNAGTHALHIIYDLGIHIMNAARVPLNFNHVPTFFLPKGSQISDRLSVDRTPAKLRLVSWSQEGRKAVARTFSSMLLPAAELIVHEQGGTKRGKQMEECILTVEAEAFCAIISGRRAGIALLDLNAAFPSVAWQYLWLLLGVILPRRFVRALRAMYYDACLIVMLGGKACVKIRFLCGIF